MHYQVLSRRFRPQKFADVLSQDPICITLKNAIKQKRIAQAYLFCGSRGTGKTTLARIFAKALNCMHPQSDVEPCNECASCKEIGAGNSLDVLEIDGASHRGIDDIRKINETVGYSTSSGGYKIIIIDEVHMLTKEAFNALLKTLEEPPKNVVFFFATTEPHKVLPTIVSRCQRFNLCRIPTAKICEKLSTILSQLGIEAETKALETIAKRAEGGLRDAESLLDQIIAFHEGKITEQAVSDALGLMPKDSLFQLDEAVLQEDFSFPFQLAETLFSSGKDYLHFYEMLIEHFRTTLLSIVSGTDALHFIEEDKEKYKRAASIYTTYACCKIIDYLSLNYDKLRQLPSNRIAIETALLYVIRARKMVPIDRILQAIKAQDFSKVPVAALEKEPKEPLLQQKSDKKEDLPSLPQSKDLTLPSKEAVNPPSDKKEPLKKVEFADAAVASVPAVNQVSSSSLKEAYVYDTMVQFAAVHLGGTVEKKKLRKNI